MPGSSLTGAHIDYLERGPASAYALDASTKATKLFADDAPTYRLLGVSRRDKADPQADRSSDRPAGRLRSEDMLAALSAMKCSVGYVVRSTGDGVSLELVVGDEHTRPLVPANALAALEAAYPGVRLDDLGPTAARTLSVAHTACVVGIPTHKPGERGDPTLPLDRLIRAMPSGGWACAVLGQPLPERQVAELRASVMNEMRAVEATIEPQRSRSALAEYYLDLLKAGLGNLTSALGVGAWRTAVYLTADNADTFRALAGVWRGLFSGADSKPEPVRVLDGIDVAAFAATSAMPDVVGKSGPSERLRHPWELQSILSSTQLAHYIHLPSKETPGFEIVAAPEFDAIVQETNGGGPTISLGTVSAGRSASGERGKRSGAPYRIEIDRLARHTFVAGVTGSGKTRTTFAILKSLAAANIPFMVIEPAKAEYRSLLKDPAFPKSLQLFTLGNEAGSPLRLNPFEVPTGTSVGVHIDLLRSVFAASLGMWTPLPQILEQALYSVYRDRGWNIATGDNTRGVGHPLSFPTLTDLIDKIDDLVPRLGYDATITGNMKTALHTRLDSLRVGGKGRMLDVHSSFPDDLLFGRSTILELEAMGDDDDKAFVMGLLFVRLVEYRRRAGKKTSGLAHLMVIEEAHRLLSAGPKSKAEGEGDPRGKAVEAFANLISEIRSYGQGVIVADQVPAKLAPDVIKNTTTKIVHRIVAGDDRDTLARCMAMNDVQREALATLKVREAAVFTEGDDAPILIRPTEVNDPADVVDAEVPLLMAEPGRYTLEERTRIASSTHPLAAFGILHEEAERDSWQDAWDRSAEIAEQREFRERLVQAVLSFLDAGGAEDVTAGLAELAFAAARHAATPKERSLLLRAALVRGITRLAQRLGDSERWSYDDTQAVISLLHRTFVAPAGAGEPAVHEESRDRIRALHLRTVDPFPGCDLICPESEGRRLCLYRHHVADAISASGGVIRLQGEWGNDATTPKDFWSPYGRIADTLLYTSGASAARVGLCALQHVLAAGGPRPQALRALDWRYRLALIKAKVEEVAP